MYFSQCTVSFIPLEVSDTKLIFAFFTLLFVKMLRHHILLNILASVFLCAFLLLSIRKSSFFNNMSVRLGNMAYKKYLNNCRISRHTVHLNTLKSLSIGSLWHQYDDSSSPNNTCLHWPTVLPLCICFNIGIRAQLHETEWIDILQYKAERL